MLHEDPHWHDTSEPKLETLRALAAAWRNWSAQEGAIPLRERFDPVDFPRLLPWVMLFEVVPGPPEMDLAIRYIGSEIEHYFDSRNVTGRRISEFGPIFLRRWAEVGNKVIAARAPRFFHGAPFQVSKSFVPMEMVALPLSKAGAGVDFLLLALAVRPKEMWS